MDQVTTEQLSELRHAFDASDKDGDGWIRSAEFQALLHVLDPELSADECLLAFDIVDDDGDGLISFEEFMGWWNGEGGG